MNYKLAEEVIKTINDKWRARHEGSAGYSSLNLHNYEEAHDFDQWLGYLKDYAKKANVYFLEKEASIKELDTILEVMPLPILVFHRDSEDTLRINPMMFWGDRGAIRVKNAVHAEWRESQVQSIREIYGEMLSREQVYGLRDDDPNEIGSEDDKMFVLVPIIVDPLVTYELAKDETYTPVQRLFHLIGSERKAVFFIMAYAVIMGLLSLILPLSVQAIISMVSGGLDARTSLTVLISFVIIATLLTGLLQITQMTVVESLQQRLFARASFEFAYRIPRINLESVVKEYTPELVNRFFDVLTLQKGLAKLLTDFLAALLQIAFGLLLLSFYHAFFVGFSITIIVIVSLIFIYTGRAGLNSSLQESKYKYRVAHWLEELARSLTTFKLAGTTSLPLNRMNNYLQGYLTKRKAHFRILILQYGSVIVFKTLVTGGVLILGSLLVIDQQITLGQFVASEIIIVTVLSAIEKLLPYIETYYDVLTALDKIGSVTDIPLEEPTSLTKISEKGYWIKTKELRYRFDGETQDTLKGVEMEVMPKEYVGIIGCSGSGKTTLLYLLTGLLHDYQGLISYNGFSLKDLNIRDIRDNIGDNLSYEDIFEGTLLENITLGKQNYTIEELQQVLETVELSSFIHSQRNGLNTKTIASGKGFSTSAIKKVILARSLLRKPKILVFDDFFYNMEGALNERVYDRILSKERCQWSVVAASHNPALLRRMDKIYVMQDGKVVNVGTYEELKADAYFASLIQGGATA